MSIFPHAQKVYKIPTIDNPEFDPHSLNIDINDSKSLSTESEPIENSQQTYSKTIKKKLAWLQNFVSRH